MGSSTTPAAAAPRGDCVVPFSSLASAPERLLPEVPSALSGQDEGEVLASLGVPSEPPVERGLLGLCLASLERLFLMYSHCEQFGYLAQLQHVSGRRPDRADPTES
jgi:hypothetical protein